MKIASGNPIGLQRVSSDVGASEVDSDSRRIVRKNSDLAVAAIALAAVGVILWFTPWDSVTVVFAAVAAVLALVGLVLPGRSRAWSVAGLAAAAVAGVVASAPLVMWSSPDSTLISVATDQNRGAPEMNDDAAGNDQSDGKNAEGAGTRITYQVVTDGLSVTHLSYVDFENGATVMRESLGVPPPFEYVVTIPRGESVNLKDFSVTGMGGASSANVRCSISIDGSVVSRQSATGAYGLVNCMGSKESTQG